MLQSAPFCTHMSHPELSTNGDPTGIEDTVASLANMAKAMLPPRTLVSETEDVKRYRQDIPAGFGEAFRERVTLLLSPTEQQHAFTAAREKRAVLTERIGALVTQAQERGEATAEDEERLRRLYDDLRYNDLVLHAVGKLTGDRYYCSLQTSHECRYVSPMTAASIDKAHKLIAGFTSGNAIGILTEPLMLDPTVPLKEQQHVKIGPSIGSWPGVCPFRKRISKRSLINWPAICARRRRSDSAQEAPHIYLRSSSRPPYTSTPMPASAAHSRELTGELHALCDHVRALGTDTLPQISRHPEQPENLEAIQRERAESYFQFALCRRIWWNLTPAERDLIRRIVLAEHPYHGRHLELYALESDCIAEVARLLADARDKARQ